MSWRTIVFAVIALVSAAIFVRLGTWQLDRLNERKSNNSTIATQRLVSSVPFASLPADTGQAHYRTATVEGRPDYEHELVYANRTRRGSPGIEILTPVRRPGTDTAVLVNRGWVYSPDGGSVDRTKWREADEMRFAGYVEVFAPDSATFTSSDPRIVRRLSRRAVSERVPYPVASYYLIAVGDTADLAHPARRDLPALGEGPHRSYAFQWFSFAIIAVVGAAFAIGRDRMAQVASRAPAEGSAPQRSLL